MHVELHLLFCLLLARPSQVDVDITSHVVLFETQDCIAFAAGVFNGISEIVGHLGQEIVSAVQSSPTFMRQCPVVLQHLRTIRISTTPRFVPIDVSWFAL